jgi:hypothetical protein
MCKNAVSDGNQCYCKEAKVKQLWVVWHALDRTRVYNETPPLGPTNSIGPNWTHTARPRSTCSVHRISYVRFLLRQANWREKSRTWKESNYRAAKQHLARLSNTKSNPKRSRLRSQLIKPRCRSNGMDPASAAGISLGMRCNYAEISGRHDEVVRQLCLKAALPINQPVDVTG